MQERVQEAFNRLIDLPLTKTTRNELVQYFHFGHTTYKTPQGLVLDVGVYTLALNCPWQLQQPDGQNIKHDEVFIRKREAGLPAPNWNWRTPGANLRDQRLLALLKAENNLEVERTELTEHFGLRLLFKNGSRLAVTPDPTAETAEHWQLFSNTEVPLKVGAGPNGIF